MANLMGQNWYDLLRFQNVTLFGVLHYRVEFAIGVHTFIRHERPDHICLELPYGLRNEVISGVKRLPYHSIILYETSESENAVLVVEGSDGILEALRSALAENISVSFVDPTPDRYPLFEDRHIDAYIVDKLGQRRFMELLRNAGQPIPGGMDYSPREVFIAARLQEAARSSDKVLFVGSLTRIPSLYKLLSQPQAIPLLKTGIKASVLAPLHPDSLKKGFTEIPRVTEAFENWRKDPASPPPINRHELILDLMKASTAYFTSKTKQEVPEYVRLTWAKFLRKWLAFKGEILPDLYHLVASARASMDEDFAYHVHEYLADYPWTNDPLDPASILLNEDHLLFHGHRIVLHKTLRTLFRTPRKYRLKAVQGAKWREHLRRKWETADPHDIDICSYPPEDVEIERWGAALMKHANHLLQVSQTDSEPFVADFGSGPDIRETLRRFHESRIYVKVREQGGMEFGSVVVIFDEDEDALNYPFQMTWLGEHSQESDMAFYSTLPGAQVVGPGISRMEYGGYLLSYPPMRMYDIWRDQDFDFVPTRHERLLVAGLAYSEKPGVVYVARKPPAKRWKRLAKSMAKKVVYVPLGALSPMHVKRMRTFHMLQNKGVRNYAHEFLKKDR